ncbi:MAG: DUF4124 domain-containing protein [Casimicrobiaceae bacterium]
MPRCRRRIVAAAFVCAAAWLAHAQASVYKCQGPAGVPVYQDSPCPAGKELRDFDKDPPTVSVMPLTPVPTQPSGMSTRQVLPAPATAPNGKAKNGARVKPARPSGSAAERKFVAPGINEGEVMARLGAPDMKSGGGGRKVARWTYLPAPDDPATVTTLTFESGRLIEVERKVVK